MQAKTSCLQIKFRPSSLNYQIMMETLWRQEYFCRVLFLFIFLNLLNTEFPSLRPTSAWAHRATGNLIQMVLKNRPTCHFYVFEHFIRFNQYTGCPRDSAPWGISIGLALVLILQC